MSNQKQTLESDVPDYFNTNFFERTLRHGLHLTDLKINQIQMKKLVLGGENYCSNIYHANIDYQRNRNEENSSNSHISLIIKSMPLEKQGILSQLQIYFKETQFYMDIIPKMEALMWYNTDDCWRLATKHLYSTTEPEQTIILEDLQQHGFKLKSRQLGLDATHTTMVMKKMAQFHALTMVITEREPELTVDSYPFGLLNIHSIKSDAFKGLFGSQLLKLISLIADNPGYEKISQKLQKYYDNFTENVLRSVYPLNGKFNVLNHGDIWVNNLFFKYDDNDEESVKEVRFIDFQLCFYGSLGFDVNYFLNSSLQLDVLENQRHLIIDSYIETLIGTLKKLPCTNITIPTYDEVLNEIQQREAYGFFVAFGFFPVMSMISVDSQDNSLEKFHEKDFVEKKVELMFKGNARIMATLKYAVKRLDDLGIFD